MADSGERLSISAVEDGLVLRGRVDAGTLEAFEQAVESCVDAGGFVRLDMRGVTALDVGALRVLVGASGRSRTSGGGVVLDSPTPAVLALVDGCGLGGVLTVLHTAAYVPAAGLRSA